MRFSVWWIRVPKVLARGDTEASVCSRVWLLPVGIRIGAHVSLKVEQ